MSRNIVGNVVACVPPHQLLLVSCNSTFLSTQRYWHRKIDGLWTYLPAYVAVRLQLFVHRALHLLVIFLLIWRRHLTLTAVEGYFPASHCHHHHS